MCPVPRQAPLGVQVHSEGSRTIKVEWQQIPPGAVDGMLQGYHVTYRKTDATFPVLKNMLTVNSSFTRVIIQGVEPLTQYEVRIAGFTRKGPGPESLKVYVTTPEDGKESRTTYKGGGWGTWACVRVAQRKFSRDIYILLSPESFSSRPPPKSSRHDFEPTKH